MNNVRRWPASPRKKANDALFRGLDLQQNNLTADAATLSGSSRRRRGDGSDAGHRLRQPARQPARQTSLQIRGLIAQQNAMATKMQAMDLGPAAGGIPLRRNPGSGRQPGKLARTDR